MTESEALKERMKTDRKFQRELWWSKDKRFKGYGPNISTPSAGVFRL